MNRTKCTVNEDRRAGLNLGKHNKQAAIAQLVERIHGKDEVSSSNLDRGSTELSSVCT